MKRVLFNNWYTMRWIRLALAIFFIVAYFTIQKGDYVALIAAGFFGMKAILNVGCCCNDNTCSIPAYLYPNCFNKNGQQIPAKQTN
jgi:hypothetical protein